MAEVLEFIFGGTVLWGMARFGGVLFLIVFVVSWTGAVIKWIRQK